ncbi:sensor histidine kinase [Mucilaginibacter sp. CAU 1740]|uniref:sensor histidine kinase n=1 Tax=Mucilaginibacter sp. CAU 1740 TaxID=3140365 RepID=UPI00325A44DC
MNININTSAVGYKLILISLLLLSSIKVNACYYYAIGNKQAGALAMIEDRAVDINEDQTGVIPNIIVSGIVILLAVLLSVYNAYRLKRLNRSLLNEKQKQIAEQKQALQYLITDNNRLHNEKDWLLKEVHHRVKNNLQIVMSLLNTQSAFLKNNAALAAIRESQNRVQAIALIHQKLYSNFEVAYIDMTIYIQELINYLGDCYNAPAKDIRFEQQTDPVKMDVSQAIPVGLMLNEAITNAIKYAFPDGGGIINLSMHVQDDHCIVLKISDNGIGLPADFNIRETSSLGMEMMKALSKQLDGNLKMESDQGLTITLIFKGENNFGNVDSQNYSLQE